MTFAVCPFHNMRIGPPPARNCPGCRAEIDRTLARGLRAAEPELSQEAADELIALGRRKGTEMRQARVTKPRLLLDVDGVLNAVPFDSRSRRNPWPDYQRSRVNGFTIWWSPSMVARLVALSERVEVLWLTTWEDLAPLHIAPALGLPAWDLAGRDPNVHEVTGWWKFDVARDLYERDLRPFIWIDDDFAFWRPANEWMEGLPRGVGVAIAPTSEYGITPTHLDLIEAFLGAAS